MANRNLLLCVFSSFIFIVTLAQNTTDNLKYVDQLIGSANGGNVFPGATLPYGMAKAVADVDSQSNQGGFTTENGNVTGFGTMHDSGTGGSPSLGNFALFPYASCPGDDVNRCRFPKKERKVTYKPESVKASPGYFGIELSSGMKADMTTAQHTSLFRFSFPSSGNSTGGSPLILLDLTDLADSRQDNATISVNSETGRMTGSARFLPSFGSGTWIGYFCADFTGAAIRDNGVFVNSRASNATKEIKITRSINASPLPGGGFIRFASNPADGILARIAVSLISSEQACTSAEAEIPDFDFEGTHAAAEDAWREKLSPISVSTTGVDPSLLTNFFSGIYRTMVNPQNYTGENPKWETSASAPYFDSFYCLWDSFRSQLPFLTILDPLALTQMVQSLISTYEHEGWLPDCRMTLCKGYTQGGSNADVVLADAYIKGLGADRSIDWETGYSAVVKDAEIEPFSWSNEGRGGLDSWKALGYIPTQDFDYNGFGTMTRSVSRTLEYAYNDFCIAKMAEGLADEGDVEKYTERSGNWKNLFYGYLFNGQDTGFTGFFQGRFQNGTWHNQDPLWCSTIDPSSSRICSLQNNGQETFESSLWEYGFYVPGDQAGLIATYGGPDAFVKRLDYLHDQNITYIGNEPSFLTVFQYHYAGRPALSAVRSHFYIPRYFSPTNAGLPGNDDSGAMGSFVAMSMMGLFPNPGQNVYLITPPFFESVSITSPLTGKTATIRNVNFDPTYAGIYIQSATLDGKPYTKNWIDHSFFTEGKELVLTLGRNESAWGARVEDLPPSLSEYVGFGNGTVNRTVGFERRWRLEGRVGSVEGGASGLL
ncbi:glycoside hydrolase family 92 protein [Lentithecium fluviatile CBS 122367]|uniref:Glycoside hydrolase family 92 protein n=1 Tax=Lentithecium fluviatile CBS 122367 TaxID=1168545 RepID=A0A6G1IMF0_9PLEO|nr:glycoside hydrolase family 92 protein [Lentithecium fluviatile CBS 122367]